MIASELKIHGAVFTLTYDIWGYVENFPRLAKYTIGQKMLDKALQLFESIQCANMYKDRRQDFLNTFIVDFETLKVMIRMVSEKRIISIGQQAHLAELTESIGKQVTAWKKRSSEEPYVTVGILG